MGQNETPPLQNPYFDTIVTLIYLKELALNISNHSDSMASFLDSFRHK